MESKDNKCSFNIELKLLTVACSAPNCSDGQTHSQRWGLKVPAQWSGDRSRHWQPQLSCSSSSSSFTISFESRPCRCVFTNIETVFCLTEVGPHAVRLSLSPQTPWRALQEHRWSQRYPTSQLSGLQHAAKYRFKKHILSTKFPPSHLC